ncbi:uncharacterized protein LOC134272856 [Saccostrea cucullata]|uniref:uncharacterized protein LOC134272856 n=1 Tax=Saccostrea cuccullata TaxID=36930 RepID=UPI002ED1A63C
MSTVASHKPQHAEQPQQRVVRKEPQVRPINRYAPPDYMTLMYHPTPTLEDLGLTSYLDSPPSSPRTRSPAREEETADSQPERESARRVLSAWDAPTNDFFDRESKTTNSQAREFRIAVSADKQSSKIDTVSARRVLQAWGLPKSSAPEQESRSISADSKLHVANSVAREIKQTTSVARQPLPFMSDAKERNHKRPPTPTEINQHLSKKFKPQGYVPSFVPKGWVPPADKYSEGHTPKVTYGSEKRNQRSLSNLSTDAAKSMMTSQTEHTSAKTSSHSNVSSSLATRPKKVACDWSMIAERYSTESRQSDDMEGKRDAMYRRYTNEGRLFGGEQRPDAVRHQNQTQDAWRHPNSSQTQSLSKHTFNQTNAAGNINDLFGGMSPYSCWIQSTPEDRRCS